MLTARILPFFPKQSESLCMDVPHARLSASLAAISSATDTVSPYAAKIKEERVLSNIFGVYVELLREVPYVLLQELFPPNAKNEIKGSQ